jgi:four helix bundle protein
MRNFKDLQVWGKAHNLTLAVYRATKCFPKDELYGLTSQMRRSAASVSANIAEGCGRPGTIEFARFLHIAMGSASELEYHLLLAKDLELLRVPEYLCLETDVSEVKRMLVSFAQKLKPVQAGC